ncbi:MAG: RNA polymerase sigma factor [Deltaproteobacteria bacterium]|nr:RNA polymerase sigma factor [Deltaproteobacteria bacterium]
MLGSTELKPEMWKQDLELAESAAMGDESSSRKLAARVFERVRNEVWYLAGNDQEMDDIVQSALLEILRSIHTFRGESSLESWADTIVVRTAMRFFKKRRKSVILYTDDISGIPSQDSVQFHCRSEIRDSIRFILRQLPEKQRVVCVLRIVEGYSISEISEMTDTPLNTVRDQLRVGRKRISSMINENPNLSDWITGE